MILARLGTQVDRYCPERQTRIYAKRVPDLPDLFSDLLERGSTAG